MPCRVIGIPLSLLLLFLESQFSSQHTPMVKVISSSDANFFQEDGLVSRNIKLIALSSDINFITVNRVTHTVTSLLYTRAVLLKLEPSTYISIVDFI